MRPIQTTRMFGAVIRGARKDRGLSQAELAAKAGVGQPWLSELEETGKRTRRARASARSAQPARSRRQPCPDASHGGLGHRSPSTDRGR